MLGTSTAPCFRVHSLQKNRATSLTTNRCCFFSYSSRPCSKICAACGDSILLDVPFQVKTWQILQMKFPGSSCVFSQKESVTEVFDSSSCLSLHCNCPFPLFAAKPLRQSPWYPIFTFLSFSQYLTIILIPNVNLCAILLFSLRSQIFFTLGTIPREGNPKGHRQIKHSTAITQVSKQYSFCWTDWIPPRISTEDFDLCVM